MTVAKHFCHWCCHPGPYCHLAAETGSWFLLIIKIII